MRCPKCRLILAEYNQACPRCSYDLTELNQELGPFYEPNLEAMLEWFSLEESPDLGEATSLGALEEPGLDLPDTNDLLFGEEEAASGSGPEEDASPSILEDILGGEEDLASPGDLEATALNESDQGPELLPEEEVPLLDEVPAEEDLGEPLETKGLEEIEEIEDIGEIEEVDIDQVLEQDTSLGAEEHLDEIPDLEELLPPELQETQKKEGQG